MSFCSYEEAWGSPFNPHQNYDHVTKTKENENTKDIVLEKNNDPVSENGMVETAPLRGSLLGGELFQQNNGRQMKYKIHKMNLYILLKPNLTKKLTNLSKVLNRVQTVSNNPLHTTLHGQTFLFLLLSVLRTYLY